MSHSATPENYSSASTYSQGPIPADHGPMLELLRKLHLVWTNWRFIALLTVVISIAMLNVVLLIPEKYSASTLILIDPRGLQVVEKDMNPRSELSATHFPVVESQMVVMTSDEVLRSVITSQHLETDPEFGGEEDTLLFDLRGIIYGLFGIAPQDPKIKALRELRDAVSTVRMDGSYVVDLRVKTKDPTKSARIANALANTYVQTEFSERANRARRASSAMMEPLDALGDRLRQAEDRVEKYKAANNIVNSEGKLVNEQQLNQLNQELSLASAQTSRALSKYEQFRLLQQTNVSPGAIAEAVKSETIKALRVDYAAAQQTLMSLASQLMPAHPHVQRARARVVAAGKEIASELDRIAEAAGVEYERAKGNEQDLTRNVEKLKDVAHSTNEAQVKLRALKRDAESNDLVYKAFSLRARELGEQQGVDTSIARIITPAIPPIKPTRPRLLWIIALSLAAGLGVSTLYVLVRDAFGPLLPHITSSH